MFSFSLLGLAPFGESWSGQHLLQQVRQTRSAIQIDPIAHSRRWSQIASHPVAERLWIRLLGLQHVDQTERVQAFRPNLLLVARLRPGDNENVLLEGQHLTRRVVAPHGNYAFGP